MKTIMSEKYVSPVAETVILVEDAVLLASPTATGDPANDGGEWY